MTTGHPLLRKFSALLHSEQQTVLTPVHFVSFGTLGQTVNPNIVVSGIGHGTGVTPNSVGDRYNLTGWSQTGIDSNDYIGFTLTPNAGYKISFTDFTYTGQKSGTGPASYAFRSSQDGFTANIGTPTATGTTIDLSSFTNLTSSITFRLFGWGASNANGSFSVNDFQFNGSVASVAAVPEPTSILLGSIAGIGTLGAWHRKRKKAKLA